MGTAGAVAADAVKLKPSPHAMAFRLADLPPEIRHLIWDATLPERRVFHVSDCAKIAYPNPEEKGDEDEEAEAEAEAEEEQHEDGIDSSGMATWQPEPGERTFDFYIRHAPPLATQICRESRMVALSSGFFFLSPSSRSPVGPPSPGAWFNPRRDMLYLDRNMRHRIKAEPRLHVAGMDRVLHVGVEWRAWFRDIPRLREGQDMCPHWRAALEPLLLCCPRAETVSFVLPRVRHVGGVTFGREPYGAAQYPCDLAPLPDGIQVPWEKLPQLAPGAALGTPGLALSLTGGTSTLTEWRTIRREMEAALDSLGRRDKGAAAEMSHEWGRALLATQGRRHGRRAPSSTSVRGWWLLRPGAPTNYEQQQVREFLS